jgi:hypothetical protein
MNRMRIGLLRGFGIGGIVCGLVVAATPARAELVFFASGRSLSVKAYRVDGESLVLTLRSGGEIVCERSGIARIEPDEVPYPDPEPDVKPAAVPPVASLALVPYGEIIDLVAARHGVPAGLVRAVIKVESAYGRDRRKGPWG